MQSGENKFACFILSLMTLGVVRFFSVPQGYVRFVTAFGKFRRKCDPGLGHCLSFLGLYQKPTRLVPIMEQVYPLSSERVYTSDGLMCTINTVIFFTLQDTYKAIFEIQNYEKGIESLIESTVRNECGRLAARELLSARQKLADQLKAHLDTDTAPWGISVRLVEITGIEIRGNEPRKE
jgi:regulator of protease activity HflC (stomatin/prohibitin superfamily)